MSFVSVWRSAFWTFWIASTHDYILHVSSTDPNDGVPGTQFRAPDTPDPSANNLPAPDRADDDRSGGLWTGSPPPPPSVLDPPHTMASPTVAALSGSRSGNTTSEANHGLIRFHMTSLDATPANPVRWRSSTPSRHGAVPLARDIEKRSNYVDYR